MLHISVVLFAESLRFPVTSLCPTKYRLILPISVTIYSSVTSPASLARLQSCESGYLLSYVCLSVCPHGHPSVCPHGSTWLPLEGSL